MVTNYNPEIDYYYKEIKKYSAIRQVLSQKYAFFYLLFSPFVKFFNPLSISLIIF